MTRPCPACGTTPAPVAPEERARFLASLTSGADVLALQRRAEAAERERDALRADVRAFLALHWTATAEMGACDQTEASVDAAVAAERATLDALRRAVG